MATVTLTTATDQQVKSGDTYKYTVGSGETRVRLLIKNPHIVKLRAYLQPGGSGEEYAMEIDGALETAEKRTGVIDPVAENDVIHLYPVSAPDTATSDTYINVTGTA